MKKQLSIQNIKKVFKTKDGVITAIDKVSFDLNEGEIVAIIGTSGCGKSTLLNIIAGLDDMTEGKIEFARSNPKISYMLQSDALLPWRSVLDNACLGLELMHEKDETSIDRVKALLAEYGLNDFINAKPSSLSGGMKQRVALIRSLAINPDIILLDEPFSALDYCTRISIASDVREIIKETNTTTIIITHDIAEALSLADRVVVLSKRPSIVKKIYDLDFEDGITVLEKRGSAKFNDLYEKIWRDLDNEEI